jgi:DNA-binding YbaB/EbfC family protein
MKGGMGNLLKQAQKMQKEIERIQNELADMKIEGSAGGGMVTATASGQQELLEIKIDPEVVDPDDVEMLEDLVLAAVNQALETAKATAEQEMAKATGGMGGGLGIPGL